MPWRRALVGLCSWAKERKKERKTYARCQACVKGALASKSHRMQLGAVPFVVEHVRELVRGIRARAMDVLRLHPDSASFEVGRSWGPEVVGRAAAPLLRC